MLGWGLWRSRGTRALRWMSRKGGASGPVSTNTVPRVERFLREGWGGRTLGSDNWLMLDPAVFGVEGIESWVTVKDLIVGVQVHLEAIPQDDN